MIQYLYFIHLVFYTPKPVKKSKHKISPLKLHEKFVNKIVNDEGSMNNERFKKYFGYHNLSFLVYIKPIQLKSEQIVNQVNDALIDLNDFNKKEVLENENPDKVIDIVKKTSLL